MIQGSDNTGKCLSAAPAIPAYGDPVARFNEDLTYGCTVLNDNLAALKAYCEDPNVQTNIKSLEIFKNLENI